MIGYIMKERIRARGQAAKEQAEAAWVLGTSAPGWQKPPKYEENKKQMLELRFKRASCSVLVYF